MSAVAATSQPREVLTRTGTTRSGVRATLIMQIVPQAATQRLPQFEQTGAKTRPNQRLRIMVLLEISSGRWSLEASNVVRCAIGPKLPTWKPRPDSRRQTGPQATLTASTQATWQRAKATDREATQDQGSNNSNNNNSSSARAGSRMENWTRTRGLTLQRLRRSRVIPAAARTAPALQTRRAVVLPTEGRTSLARSSTHTRNWIVTWGPLPEMVQVIRSEFGRQREGTRRKEPTQWPVPRPPRRDAGMTILSFLLHPGSLPPPPTDLPR
mmetsp:Transcript_88195/g.184289  ORF Transcript_88195/g.184289 Transcript_88195/m.184289 type:complete len:269 (-) Transcript_88195:621-1427(-)